MLRCKYCGATHSRSKKPFTQTSLNDHIRTKHPKTNRGDNTPEEDSFPLTNSIVSDDESDGVFFAMAWELGEL
jgi:hypothetical protein